MIGVNPHLPEESPAPVRWAGEGEGVATVDANRLAEVRQKIAELAPPRK